MFLGSGITLPKTSSKSYRFFALVACRVRVRWMCPGAVLGTAPGITVLRGGGRQEAFAPRVTKARKTSRKAAKQTPPRLPL
jgi:hypothetical protein